MDSETYLKRWIAAGLLDEPAAERIRIWEATKGHATEGFRWPVLVALIFGALLLGAGVLLFVSAHWDQISPNGRLAIVIVMVAGFHIAGAAVTDRFEGLAIALHTVGTLALGAGIALTGQIYHLSEHWPGAILLWAIGAAAAWAILRHWTQGALVALLVPTWLGSEWSFYEHTQFEGPLAAGICALSLTYLSFHRKPYDNTLLKALAWVGGIALLPSAFLVAVARRFFVSSEQERYLGLAIAFIAPLLLAIWIRRQAAIWNLGATFWVAILLYCNSGKPGSLIEYIWCAIGAVGLVAWGVSEERAERINLGIAGFALTILIFYFSDVMDKLDRSLSLVLLGFLFLGGGWVLERTRRRLVARIRQETP